MALPYFRNSKRGRWLFVGMILLTLLQSAANVVFSYASKEFYNALEKKDAAVFQRVLIIYTSILVAGAPLTAFYNFQRQRLAVAWREWMTQETMVLYMRRRVYYLLDKDIDNPDQRIAQDVNAFTNFSLTLLVTMLDNVINLISMSVILYSIEPQLFLVIIAYAFVGTAVSVWLGGRLVPLNFERLQFEADLRYTLVRLREHGESIAFYRGETVEESLVRDRLDAVVANQRDVIGMERNLDIFTALYQYMTWVLPIAMIAPRYFTGAVELGVVTQARSAFLQVTTDLSIIIQQFKDLATFSAGIDRLSSFYVAVRDADDSRSPEVPLLSKSAVGKLDMRTSGGVFDAMSTRSGTIVLRDSPPPSSSSSSPTFVCTNLTLSIPDSSRTLIYGLTIPQQQQQLQNSPRLLVTGPSGVGKSSLLRAIGGLWTAGEGTIERPADAFFLPQQPYCTLGSLRQQLLYPTDVTSTSSSSCSYSDQDLITTLHRIGLSHLQDELNHVTDWSHRLSLGEQQRLAFGRVALHRPSFCLLDEATSALDLDSERNMYQLLQQIVVSYVSVGHRPSLYRFHTQRLELNPNGSYELTMIES